jgi:hypothetical protein
MTEQLPYIVAPLSGASSFHALDRRRAGRLCG